MFSDVVAASGVPSAIAFAFAIAIAANVTADTTELVAAALDALAAIPSFAALAASVVAVQWSN